LCRDEHGNSAVLVIFNKISRLDVVFDSFIFRQKKGRFFLCEPLPKLDSSYTLEYCVLASGPNRPYFLVTSFKLSSDEQRNIS